MKKDYIMIPQDSLLEILKMQPESVLIRLFDELFISSDASPLTEEEIFEIKEAKEEYQKGETITWKQ